MGSERRARRTAAPMSRKRTATPKPRPAGPAATRLPAAGPPHSLLVALAVALALAPTLARSPQSGDGAEVVMTALRGGVLHPPGFPLQAWLDRGLAVLAGAHVALAIAALGLAAHAAAAGLIAATLRRLGVAAMGRVLGAAAFALFPPLWANAVQPELFALAHAWVALATWLAVRSAAPARPGSAGGAAAIGIVGALGAATHPVGIAASPAWLVAAWGELRGSGRRGLRLGILLASLAVPLAALYLSLLAIRTASPWPDWGALRTPADVMHHALRVDYGTFEMSGMQGPGLLVGLGVWFNETLRAWNVALALALVGALSLAIQPARRAGRLPILGVLLASLALLWRARLPEQSYTASEMARLSGPATIAGALLLGVGWQFARERAGQLVPRRALAALAALAAAVWLAYGWTAADTARDRTLDLYVRGVAMELPPEAVYVAEGDVECFYGVPGPAGRRFPVAAPQCALDRYQREVAPKIEPRLFDGRRIYPAWEDVLRECGRRGLEVAGASIGYIAIPPDVPELHGLILLGRPGGRAVVTRETVTAAVRLAPLAAELPALPARGHAFSRFYTMRFARAYAGAAAWLRSASAPGAAMRADSVATALGRFLPPPERRARLRDFVAAARAAGF